MKSPIFATILIIAGTLILVWSKLILKKLKIESHFIAWRGFFSGVALVILGLMVLHDCFKDE
jgi:hypothetical protein